MGAPRDEERIYERFQLVVNGPALFNAVVTALELDVFGFLSKNPGAGFDSVRQATGLPAHQLRVLMLALCGTELIAKEDGGYVNSSVADTMLAADTPESWRDTLLGWRKFQYPAFPHLTTALRSGTNTALDAYPGTGTTLYDRLAHDPELEAAYHHSIAPFTHLFLTPLLDNPEFAEVRHLLDIGGGDGTTAVRFAERYPDARVTIFDLPSVARHAGESLPPETAGRIRLLGGDIFTDDFPDDVDGILFSHVLEPFSAEQGAALVAKAYRALPPGGKVFTYGMTAPDEEDAGLLTARLSLFLNVLASGQGMAHPAKDYEAWIRQAGCRDVRAYTGMPYEHGLVVGRKEAGVTGAMALDGDFEHFERILRANLPVSVPGRLHPAGRLADFGLDSLLLIQLVVQLEEAFGVDIPDELLTARTFETVDSLWTVLCGLAGPVESFE